MIRKLLRFLINVLAFVLIGISIGRGQTDLHKLEIISKKPFEVFINDYSLGIHLNFDTLLSSNIYKIEAYLIDTGTVKTVFKQNVNLNSNFIIQLDSVYPVTIKSYPEDALVYFDSIYFGSTPLSLNLLFRPKLLELSKKGFVNIRKDIGSLDEYNFFIKFERDSQEKKGFIFQYKYIALASTVISGALAAYTKQLANKYYHKANRTDEDMRKVKIYDRYSGIFTIGMEISFGIFVYMLFQE